MITDLFSPTTVNETWRADASCSTGTAQDVFLHPLLDLDISDLEPTEKLTLRLAAAAVAANTNGDMASAARVVSGLSYARRLELADKALTEAKAPVVAEARAVCAGCPVLANCMKWALTDDVVTFTAGLTGSELADQRSLSRITHRVIDTSDYVNLASDQGEQPDSLTPEEAIRLRSEGLKVKEIAAARNVSPRTVARMLAAAKTTMAVAELDTAAAASASTPARIGAKNADKALAAATRNAVTAAVTRAGR